MSTVPHVLIIGSTTARAAWIARELMRDEQPLVCEYAEDLERLRATLDVRPWDAVMLDADLPDSERGQALAVVDEYNREHGSEITCIVVSEVPPPARSRAAAGSDSNSVVRASVNELAATVAATLRETAVRRERYQSELALKARVRQQAIVAELGQRALAGADPHSLIAEAVRTVPPILDVDCCAVFEVAPKGDTLVIRPGAGWDSNQVPIEGAVPIEPGSQVGYTFASNEPVIVDDYAIDTRFHSPAAILERGVVSGVTVAMRSRDRSYGVLTACGRQRRSFTPDDVHFLQSVANVLAAALERRHAEAALRESEERLRQSQKLEAVGLLAGGIAHDFNNLLTAVVGFSELLLVDLDSEDPRRSYAEEIRKAGERAAGLTTQLLAFSRRQVLQPRMLDLNAVVAGMEQLLRRAVTDRVQIVRKPSPGLGRVLADQHQIEQVLLNLAVNARDAMPQGGALTIQTANAELPAALAPSDAESGPYVMLAVTDTGTGMDAATQAHIFEPFFTTKEPGRGTGLGLATVYGIVKQSGGEIEVRSEVGRGTTFSIYLPAAEKGEDIPEQVTVEAPTPGGRETILLVEDEDGVRALARTVLQSGGYTVLEASRGDEALHIYETHDGPIDLLITDLVMPGMSGRELAERVTTLGRPTRVLYMSGYTNDRLLEFSGAYLQKPIAPRMLAQKVREVLESPNPEVRVGRA